MVGMNDWLRKEIRSMTPEEADEEYPGILGMIVDMRMMSDVSYGLSFTAETTAENVIHTISLAPLDIESALQGSLNHESIDLISETLSQPHGLDETLVYSYGQGGFEKYLPHPEKGKSVFSAPIESAAGLLSKIFDTISSVERLVPTVKVMGFNYFVPARRTRQGLIVSDQEIIPPIYHTNIPETHRLKQALASGDIEQLLR